MLLLLDNYDSFTFNLAQYFMVLGEKVHVARNDQLSVTELLALEPTRVCISPGPGRPRVAGVTLELIAAWTDASWLRPAGTTTYGFGLLSEQLSPDEYWSRFHGVDERISIENYAEIIDFYGQLLRNAAGPS